MLLEMDENSWLKLKTSEVGPSAAWWVLIWCTEIKMKEQANDERRQKNTKNKTPWNTNN